MPRRSEAGASLDACDLVIYRNGFQYDVPVNSPGCDLYLFHHQSVPRRATVTRRTPEGTSRRVRGSKPPSAPSTLTTAPSTFALTRSVPGKASNT